MSISKKIVVKLLSIAFIAIVVMSAFMTQNETIYACSCAPFDSLESELAVTDVVFDGIVVSSNKVKSGAPAFENIQYTFHVNGIWKGQASDELVIYSAPYSDSCGFEFQDNERYAVFALTDSKGELHTSICSGTSKLQDNSPLLSQLGEYTYVNEEAAPLASATEAGSVVAPDDIKNIVTEEDIKQSISERKNTVIIVFLAVGGLFLIAAAIIIGNVIRRMRS